MMDNPVGETFEGMALVSSIWLVIFFIGELALGLILTIIVTLAAGYNDPTYTPIIAIITFLLVIVYGIYTLLYALVLSNVVSIMVVILFTFLNYLLFNLIMPLLFGSHFTVFPLFTLV